MHYCQSLTRNAMPSFVTAYPSPFGTILLHSDGNALTGLRFVSSADVPVAQAVVSGCSSAPELPIFAQTRQWLDDYFACKRPCDMPRLNPLGTDFQCRVWQSLFTICYGQTKTYGEIAEMVGCRSARAVGQAIGHNPIALIIPCHRVVGANGNLGGYAYGIDRKKHLLEWEKQYACHT